MKMREINQLEFSTVLFDALFSLVLFFGMDSFLDMPNIQNFIFYIFSIVILIHWWLLFKSADDTFNTEVTDSIVDIIFGVADIILLEYIILFSKSFNFTGATYCIVALFVADIMWAVLWRFIGKWDTEDNIKIRRMELSLNKTIIYDLIFALSFLILVLLNRYFSSIQYITAFIILYITYILSTFKEKIIDIQIF